MSKAATGKRLHDDIDDVADKFDAAKDAARDAADSAIETVGGVVSNINSKLKSVGVDTSVMTDAAKDQVTDLQKILADELKARPFRSLAIAAGVGLLFGLLANR